MAAISPLPIAPIDALVWCQDNTKCQTQQYVLHPAMSLSYLEGCRVDKVEHVVFFRYQYVTERLYTSSIVEPSRLLMKAASGLSMVTLLSDRSSTL